MKTLAFCRRCGTTDVRDNYLFYNSLGNCLQSIQKKDTIWIYIYSFQLPKIIAHDLYKTLLPIMVNHKQHTYIFDYKFYPIIVTLIATSKN